VKLYYSPLACSLSSRIALYEAGAEATFVEVDPLTKTTSDGADFRAINPLGLRHPDRERRHPAVHRGAVSEGVARAAGRRRPRAAAPVAVVHRDGAAQGSLLASPHAERAGGREGVRPIEGAVAPLVGRDDARGPRVRARRVQRGRRVSVRRPELVERDAGGPQAMADDHVISGTIDEPAERRTSLRGGAKALRSRASSPRES
jgi:hypothetical protein